MSKNEGLTMSQLAEINAKHVTTIAALEAKCASLAAKLNDVCADNARLTQALSFAEPWLPTCDNELTGLIQQAKQTPATDAFLAEVRAQGVEMFASKCKEESKLAHSSDARDSWWVSGENAEDFAAQLRGSQV